MSVSVTKATLAELNEQYIKYQPTIQKLEIRLKEGVKELSFTENDLTFALEYTEDHVTIFRFLKDSDFDEEKAYQRLIDTILWRKEMNISQITWETVHSSFFKSEHIYSFFYERDLLGRPIAIIRMRHFPDFGNEKLSDTIPPFACLVMEIARQWTLDLTRQNELQQQQQEHVIDLDDDDIDDDLDDAVPNNPSILVAQITVIIDIAKAPMIPLEKKLIQELLSIMDGRFPGFFGSIYMMNFGWMYQGIWQMVKLMLSEKAKSKVNFPSLQEVKHYISEDILLKELGGSNDFEWSLENDEILKKYGCGWKPPSSSPSLSSIMSPDLNQITRPSRSSSVSSFSSVEFYDALETPSLQPKLLLSDNNSRLSSFYGTPGSLTPISSYTPTLIPRSLAPPPILPSVSSSSSNNQYFITGLHIPSFLSSIFSTSSSSTTQLNINKMSQPVSGLDLTYRLSTLALEQQMEGNTYNDDDDVEAMLVISQDHNQQLPIGQRRPPHFPHLLPADDPHSLYASSPLKMQLRRSEQRLIRFTRRLFRLSFAYNGTVYWVLLYIFLRGPFENNIKKLLTKMMINPRAITYTTVGLTASAAAGLSISLSNSLSH